MIRPPLTDVPLAYVWRSLLERRGSSLLTIGSFALVVLILIGLLAMVQGIDRTLVGTGDPSRLFVLGKESTSESQSRVAQQDALAVGTYADIRLDASASPLTSLEISDITYVRRADGDRVQGSFRGVDLDRALRVHDTVRLVEGRFIEPEASFEVVAGRGALAALGVGVGGRFTAWRTTWHVVGVFSDNGSPFESEIWTSRRNLELARRTAYISSVWVLVRDPHLTRSVVEALNADQSIAVNALTEEQYFAQGASTAASLRALAWFVAVIMSIGAVFSAMNTMYASVADRAPELATLRAIGFSPGSVLVAIVIEASLLATAGGLLAALAALALDGVTFSTAVPGIGVISFQFVVAPALLGLGLAFAIVMGLVGGFFPARRAIRIPIVEALQH